MTDVAAAIQELRQAGLYRELKVVESAQGPRVQLDGREVLLLCSNDYLGLAGHPNLRAAAAEAAERWGAGAGASRLVSGNMSLHRELEDELAAFKGYPRCVLFGSGFLANLGVIAALAGRDEVVLSDALNHASIVDGCRQSRAETIVYPHGDLDALGYGLRRAGSRPALIVTDAVFSMDGELAPLEGIVELAQRYRARVLVDEAHATGVVGPGGRGLVAALGLERQVDVVIGTLSKALGSYGAFVCCSTDVAEYLVNRARTLIYSTALPPPTVAAGLMGVRLLRDEPARVARLWANARSLRSDLATLGFDVATGEMPIVPLILGDPQIALAVSEQALRDGVFAHAIRPPTVPPGTSRLRVVATAAHSPQELKRAVRTLAAAREQSMRDAIGAPS
jgi:glycine C-acetyltransferase/8-amino-7-oxononanoate synthase